MNKIAEDLERQILSAFMTEDFDKVKILCNELLAKAELYNSDYYKSSSYGVIG